MTLSLNYDAAVAFNPPSTSLNQSLSVNGGLYTITDISVSVMSPSPVRGGTTINSTIDKTLRRSYQQE